MKNIYICSVFLFVGLCILADERYSWVLFLSGTIFLVVDLIMTYEFGEIAKMKGYREEKYLWYTFFFSLFGALLIIALPARSEQNNEVIIPKEESLFDDIPSL